ncbi:MULTISPECIES: M24 family metallopeptidase [Rhizobium/Agrobacterium group]|uniref:M24 family metallopeptidase n=1 Tax=Rhizobium/Agrobacterium group TaxID=227290 RepID=UPI0008FB2FB4|nr:MULTISPECIES: Xaa-Pro peptidase family protein [Rhizobium/Agrobacterium group]MCF1464856.1 aminopeptidase P family protein [Allorhizobium ampelinum]MCF1496021.1 aminopeptidase P family protein [Allorhizobium ampelinum]MUZ55542.1 M24 family metallopeptidase [Agrobacterium vitis]MUZ94782.1 M24 family metallopeptidase [Agrobacterium vitis]MVA43144.1 M24 family metallopeptidase [Agrobacterium vitis]
MFAAAEYQRRLAKAQAAMETAAVDLLLIDSGELLAWATGYTVSETMYRAAFLPREGEAWFTLRALDEAPCREKSWISDVTGFRDTEDAVAAVAASIVAHGFGNARIGLDTRSYSMNAETCARLGELLPEAWLVPMPGLSDSLRWVKSDAEIAVLRQASEIADKAMLAIAQQAKPGMTTRDAAAIASGVFLREGADTGEVGPIVKAAGSHEFLHGVFKTETIGAGDILHCELIPRVGNYGARMMRPVMVGTPSAELAATAERLVALQDRQVAAMKPGTLARDVDAIMRQGALDAGLRPDYENVTAYTLGLYTRTPRTSDFSRVLLPTSDWGLEEGMVFHLYATAQGLGFSETVVVGKDCGLRLTTCQRQILQPTIL